VRHSRILDLIAAVIGPDILVFHTTAWLKAPHGELCSVVPGRELFRTGAVRACHRLGALPPSRPESGLISLPAGERAQDRLRPKVRRDAA
jgi:hypothetical protein